MTLSPGPPRRQGGDEDAYTPGRNTANEVMIRLSPKGTICGYVHTTAHVIVDVVGYV